MVATTRVIFHLSSFKSASNLLPFPLLTLHFHHHLPSPSTCIAPSSHDHFAVVQRPQVLIVKASPDTPPHSVCSPVRLIPQIWVERRDWSAGGGGGKELSVSLSGHFFDESTCSECWQPVFQSSMSSTQEKKQLVGQLSLGVTTETGHRVLTCKPRSIFPTKECLLF